MRQRTSRRGLTAISGVVVLVLQACTIPVNRPLMESLLTQAGFQVRRADTPERLANIQALTPLKLERHDRDGVPHYVFADPKGCQCVYVGDAAAYARFQKLAQESQLEAEKRVGALANPGGPMVWGVWDPFFW
jgi:hypothetical protein